MLTYMYIQPLFVSLAQQWNGYQDEVVLLSVLSSLLSQLSPFTDNCSRVAEGEGVAAMLGQATVLSDVERRQVSCEDRGGEGERERGKGREMASGENSRC